MLDVDVARCDPTSAYSFRLLAVVVVQDASDGVVAMLPSRRYHHGTRYLLLLSARVPCIEVELGEYGAGLPHCVGSVVRYSHVDIV